MYDKNGLEFIRGRRIKNIDPREEPGANVGEKGTITDVLGSVVYVTYDNGDTGNARKPDKYYQILNEGRIAKSYQSTGATQTNSPSTTIPPMNGVIQAAKKAVKRALMSATERNLIDAGLMSECGDYTNTAIELLNQAAAAADVESTNSVLVAAATAIIADKKAQKELSS